jgi:hypothetical protein
MFERACYAALLLGFGLAALAPHPATAQQSRGRDIVYEAARNKIGLIRYCHRQGLLDRQTTDIALRVAESGLDPSAAPAVITAGDKAEEDGEAGILGPSGKRDITNFAVLFKTTPASLCKEWAAESLRGLKGRSLQETAASITGAGAQDAPEPSTTPSSFSVGESPCP